MTILKNIGIILINLFFIIELYKSIIFILSNKNIKDTKDKVVIYIILSYACTLYLLQLYFYFTKDSVFAQILLLSCILINCVSGIIQKNSLEHKS